MTFYLCKDVMPNNINKSIEFLDNACNRLTWLTKIFMKATKVTNKQAKNKNSFTLFTQN